MDCRNNSAESDSSKVHVEQTKVYPIDLKIHIERQATFCIAYQQGCTNKIEKNKHNQMSRRTMLRTKQIPSDSIQLNNAGIDHLRHGRLDEAYAVLSLASKLNQEESYDASVDESGLYCNQWISVSHVIDAVESATTLSSSSCRQEKQKQARLNMFPCCLRIDQREQSNMEGRISDQRRDEAVFTSRLDWIIEYNLALVSQLLGIVFGGVYFLNEAHNLYDQIGRDMLEWHDYSATLDIALLLIAIYNNEGCIYHQMGINDLASFYIDRVSVIYTGCSNLAANPLCRTFERNCPTFWRRDCAPAA